MFREQKPLYDCVAISTIFLSYGTSIFLITANNILINIIGALLLSISLTLSAFSHHELAHGNLFYSAGTQKILGRLVDWLNGGCYFSFEELREMHIRHHVLKVDFIAYDISLFMKGLPEFLRLFFETCEYFYLPILSFIVRIRAITSPFWKEERKKYRLRTCLVILTRMSLFLVLGYFSLRGVLFYFIGYCLFVDIMRFNDCFTHNFDVYPVGTKPPKITKDQEQEKTYSYPISLKNRWLNLIFLNFGYHNAHHHKATVPWHSLPNLNAELLESDKQNIVSPRILPFFQLVENFHKYRIKRIYNIGNIEYDPATNTMDVSNFFGVLDASFLVLEV